MVLALILLLLPTQLNHFFWPEFSYVFGLPIDHLAPALYLQDILIVTFVLVSLLKRHAGLDPASAFKPKYVIAFLFVLINICITPSPLLSLYFWLRLAILILFYYSLIAHPPKLSLLSSLLLLSSIIPTLLALAQFIHGGSLQGLFYFLGERSFNLATPGVSKIHLCLPTIGCHYYLRPYATFSHPNVLAAYLGLIWLVLLNFRKSLAPITRKLYYFFTPLIFLTILLTFSRSVFLALFLALTLPKVFSSPWTPTCRQAWRSRVCLVYLALNIAYWFVSFLIHSESLSVMERVSFNRIYTQIFFEHPFFGVGLGHSITALGEASVYWSTFTHRLFLQPPHNTLLLLLVELGLIPVFVLLAVTPRWVARQGFPRGGTAIAIFILVTSLFDHYYLTSFQLRLLFVFIILLYNNKSL